MFSYLYQEGVEPCSKEPLKVRLEQNREIIGEIRKVAGGYRYVPKGKKEVDGGCIFSTVYEVQMSLMS